MGVDWNCRYIYFTRASTSTHKHIGYRRFWRSESVANHPFYSGKEIQQLKTSFYTGGSQILSGQFTSKPPMSIGNFFAFNRGSCSFNLCRFGPRCTNCGGPHPQINCLVSSQSKTDIPLYNLANTHILYNQLYSVLNSYPFQGDKLQLFNGLRLVFHFIMLVQEFIMRRKILYPLASPLKWPVKVSKGRHPWYDGWSFRIYSTSQPLCFTSRHCPLRSRNLPSNLLRL